MYAFACSMYADSCQISSSYIFTHQSTNSKFRVKLILFPTLIDVAADKGVRDVSPGTLG